VSSSSSLCLPRRPGAARPAVTGLTLAGLGLSLGHNCGFPLNPARDLAPRMFSLLAGWGLPTFSGFWWLVPVLGAHLGGLAGVLLSLVPGVQSVTRDSPGPAAATVPYSPLRARDCEAPGSPAQKR